MNILDFTFHNVSINTQSIQEQGEYFKLYIPQCFY